VRARAIQDPDAPSCWEPTGWRRMGPATGSFPSEDLIDAVREEAARAG
jgi:hypothetical protein